MKAVIVSITIFLWFSGADLVLAQEEIRVVSISVLVDRDSIIKAPGESTASVIGAIKDSSKFFKKEFGIVFQIIRVDFWKFSAFKTEFDRKIAMDNLKNESNSNGSDLTLAFTTKEVFDPIEEISDGIVVTGKQQFDGFADRLSGTAIIRLFFSFEGNKRTKQITLHELGHLFGAEHSWDVKSVMNQRGGSERFDEISAKTIKENRQKRFSKGGSIANAR